MKVGEKVNTNLGKVLVLDIKKDYLILFNESEGKFIKANDWQEDYEKIFWGQGEYYNNLDDLIKNIID